MHTIRSFRQTNIMHLIVCNTQLLHAHIYLWVLFLDIEIHIMQSQIFENINIFVSEKRLCKSNF